MRAGRLHHGSVERERCALGVDLQCLPCRRKTRCQVSNPRSIRVRRDDPTDNGHRLLHQRDGLVHRRCGISRLSQQITGHLKIIDRTDDVLPLLDQITPAVDHLATRLHRLLTGFDCSLSRLDRPLAHIHGALAELDGGIDGTAAGQEEDGGRDRSDQDLHHLRRYEGHRPTSKSARAVRPYDLPVDIVSGPWDETQITRYLQQTAIPVRLATSGVQAPIVQSLWFLFDDDALWCCTRSDALLTQRLRRNAACGFEIAGDLPPYRGVRGTGVADIHSPDRAAEVLPQLIDRYLGDRDLPLATWLMSRLDDEVAIRIGSLRVTSYDFTTRMS